MHAQRHSEFNIRSAAQAGDADKVPTIFALSEDLMYVGAHCQRGRLLDEGAPPVLVGSGQELYVVGGSNSRKGLLFPSVISSYKSIKQWQWWHQSRNNTVLTRHT